MCGFFLNTNKNQSFGKFKNLAGLINKRGPDFNKIINLKNIKLAHFRLKILDTNKRSNQPFCDKNKRYYLLFNGEIYNYLSLKKKYSLVCSTSSDTEVLFLLLIKIGLKKTLSEIEGMFSFAFLDTKSKKILCARDHFGQKPFYYSHDKSDLICSTNLKPIVRSLKKISFKKENVLKYLSSSGILESDQTIFKNIYALKAGHFLIYEKKKLIIKRYFHPADLFDINLYNKLKKKSFSEITKKMSQNINNSINKHLISDVPIGTCLSGGIDSSLITYFALKENKHIKIFSGFSKKIEKIPKKIIPKLMKKLGTKKIYKINHSHKDYLTDLQKLLLFSYTPSRWGGGVPMSKICGEAKRKKVSVLLGGDGVDEISGGYNTINKILKKPQSKEFHSIISLDKKNIFYTTKIDNDYRRYLFKEKRYILKKLKKIKDKTEQFKQLTMLLDMSIFLQTCTLPHSDEYSMFKSVELRNPWLDIKLVEFVINLQSNLKIYKKKNKLINKYVFKELAKKTIGEFIDQPKEGTRNYSKKISNLRFWDFNKFELRKILNDLQKPNIFHKIDYKTIFKLVSLEIIYRDMKNIRYSIFRNCITSEGYRNLL